MTDDEIERMESEFERGFRAGEEYGREKGRGGLWARDMEIRPARHGTIIDLFPAPTEEDDE